MKKIHKLDLIKTKSFCASKNTSKKIKRQFAGQREISVNHKSNERRVSRIYKEVSHNSTIEG